MTSLARTYLDLGQSLSYPRLQKVIEEADRTDRLDIRAVQEVIERYAGHRGCRPLRRIVSDYLWTPDSNEGIERDFQLLLADFGLPTPQVNVLVEGLDVDCWWPASRFVVELDSRGWHKTWQAHERDRKRDAILIRAGISSLRITHRRIKERPGRGGCPRRSPTASTSIWVILTLLCGGQMTQASGGGLSTRGGSSRPCYSTVS